MHTNVLVIGATGMVGRLVVGELTKAGIPVRALVRDRSKAQRLLPSPTELLVGELLDEATVEQALHGVSHVYFHPAATTDRTGKKSMDRTGTQRLLNALPAHVHLIKLSEIGASDNPAFFDIDCKYRSELDIQERAAHWTILRPTWFMESIPQLLTLGPVSVCFGRQPHPIFWLSGQDYARTVVACVQKPAASRNQIFPLQGVESHRMFDALRLFNQAAQTGKASLRLPLCLLTLPAWFSEQYYFNQQVMRYYNQRHERFESQAAHRLLHQPTIALSEFARLFKSGVVSTGYP
jgi:uncharacterized protein YbjT (DUF2867 family)